MVESACDVACFQETKKEVLDSTFLRNVLPASFNCFEFQPSIGASGGILVAWKDSLFDGEVFDLHTFGVTIQFKSKLNNKIWFLTSIYAPCAPDRKEEFLNWWKSLTLPNDSD